jgi:NADH-quinone oxidoreductase subunit C
MQKEELKSYLGKYFPSSKIEETIDFLVLIIEKQELLEVATHLRNNAEAQFDFLFCETAIDKGTHFEVVYHLTSTTFRHNLVIKVILQREEMPEIESVTNIWKAAELFECEIFDLFGIKFLNHVTLRRIFLSNDWIGYPLRKDYKDNINVVPL